MARRIHVREVRPGTITLDATEAHHARNVLRLAAGTLVELFDDTGRVGQATLTVVDPTEVQATVDSVRDAALNGPAITIAAAVPKGDRADWMVEKLSELGVSRFIPLATARSVVLPAGKNKTERWQRIAVEAAKQSHRRGVMEIAELTALNTAIADHSGGWVLSTTGDTEPVYRALDQLRPVEHLDLFIGPEGGWTDDEITLFRTNSFVAVGLTETILRIETAAIAAAAVIACWRP